MSGAACLRLKPYGTGSYVSGRTAARPAVHSHKSHQAGDEGTYASDDDDGMAEPLTGACAGGVHLLEGACSHRGHGVGGQHGGGDRGWAGGGVQRWFSAAAGGHGMRLELGDGR